MKKITKTSVNGSTNRFYALLILMVTCISGFSQNVGINATGAAPNTSAGLDVDFPDKGVLIPRIALTGTTSFAPLAANVAGMLVYNTATAGDVTPGFYYNDGTKWVPGFPAGTAVGSMIYWNGTAWVMIPAGLPGQFLQLNGLGIPAWGGGAFATISTTAPSAVTGTSATTGGNITTDGGSAVLSRGVCYSTTPGPTTANSIVVASPATGIGSFTCNLTGLSPVITYYVKAYATNNAVTTYGNEVSFTTLPVLATLTTTAASLITGTTATSGGNVTNNGGASIIERGICYATTLNPTTANSKIIDPSPGVGTFTSNITGLTGYTLYHVRAYAINSVGTAYGNDITFTTAIVPPTLVTVAATTITGGSAASGGSMNWNGSGYSNYQNYGVAYATTPGSATPTYVATNTANGSVNPAVPIAPWTTNITGLVATTTYYIRSYLNLYRVSPAGWITVFGNELSFTTTAPTAPVVASTTAITGISGNSAKSGGTITSDGGSAITTKGVCWSTSPSPTLGVGNFTADGTGTATFISNITGLTGSTTYYVRAYATNSVGTGYGPADVSFTTWVQAPYTIGQNLGYGYCAYVNPQGGGFIVSYDISSTTGWGCPGTNIAGIGTALGTGQANTNLILAACATRPIAASIANDYMITYGGVTYSDWYLPSSGEWGVMAPIYNLLGLAGHGYNNFYTSSQYGTNYNYAATYFATGSQVYANGAQRVPGPNDYIFQLRVVRDFTTSVVATVTTDPITGITATSATSGGNVTSDGGAAVTARGVCWSTVSGPTIADSKTIDGSGTGSFISNITGLTGGPTYYVRAYATNSAGTAYGNEQSFSIGVATAPTVTTSTMYNKIGAIAEGGGTVTADGGATVSAFGLCWSTTANPTITSNLGMTTDLTNITGLTPYSYFHTLTGLTIGTTYHVRAYATNSIGTAYGADSVFTETAAFIGQTITGGAMFGNVYSIDGTGLHGLIADPWGYGTSDWGCTNSVTGATGTAIGTGQANTNAILTDITANGCTSASPMAAFAAQISLYNGPDWYLPSKDEFNLLWTNQVAAGIDVNLSTAGGLAPFWCSSEVSSTTVWYFDATLATPAWVNTGLKTDQYNVWPIRSF
ncbi:MAG: hypothetical protein M0Q38_00015 [Bacteroidales bacterium]|nr:hypothetical protein [Bacteroidales bacterium]